MDDTTIRLTDDYYIVTAASSSSEVRVLKHDESFGVFDVHGDIQHAGLGEQGIYHEGTRFLSLLAFRIGNLQPFLLSSTIKQDGLIFTTNLTNPDLHAHGTMALRRGDLHIFRTKFIFQATCYETLELANYSLSPIELSFTLQYDADFADIFEVRGIKRAARGHRLPDVVAADRVVLGYKGLDQSVRRTEIEFSPAPEKISGSRAYFQRMLPPGKHEHFSFTYMFKIDNKHPGRRSTEAALRAAEQSLKAKAEECITRTSNDEMNRWLEQSDADLHMMLTETPYGLYPYAGVPWFSTAFGRDGIITALSVLWLNSRIANGLLRYLAAYQAKEVDPERDATPGKILHEMRFGEMAALNEIPFGRYYGSTDSTPLFVMLAGAYYERTADRELIETLWPNIKAALDWIDTYGDIDGDGFVESARLSSRGLVQQGWKDSWDAISHADGSLPEPPIALCEVQAYAYAAKQAGARLARIVGDVDYARALLEQSRALRQKFNEVYWCEDLGTFAVALDNKKRPCRIVASNAGHCLWGGIATEEHAQRVAARLLSDDCYSGWGVRTLSAREVRYNPMSYHNGSVWPHDNAIFAAGLANYGLKDAVNQIITGLFEASMFFGSHRMPELFCGFSRRKGEGPTLYPAACSPQAWAAAAAFMMVEACLGFSIDGTASQVRFGSPMLPSFLDNIRIQKLKVGSASLDVVVDHSFHGIGVERRSGDASIVIY
jgi:glycogen debranching enzyme